MDNIMSSFSCLPGQVRSAGLVLALCLLVACGGGSGGGSDKPPSPTLPPSVEEEPGGNAGDDNQAGDDSDKHWVRATEYTDGSLPPIGTHRVVDAQRGKIFVLEDRKSTRLNSSHVAISYAVFCLKKK